MTSGSIIWISSYPKSGNTWLRVFLANLLRDGAASVDFNSLVEVESAASRALVDEYVGVSSAEFAADELDDLRSVAYETIAANRAPPHFMKIHDRRRTTPRGRALVPAAATRGVVYLVRNPLDVAASYAHHAGTTIDAAIDMMADDDHVLEPIARGILPMLPQHVGSWSAHVRSWTDDSDLPTRVVRFEDMKARPVESFEAIVSFAGLAHGRALVQRAVESSDFEEMRRQEDRTRFRQGSLRAARFFRRGEAGAWRDELTAAQVERITLRHADAMRRLGYLPPERAQ